MMAVPMINVGKARNSTAGTCLGIESGGSMYWDSEGNYMDATVFTDVYVSVAGGLWKITALGYEQGFGMEGRGFYTGVSGLGIHAEATQKQGYSYGFQEKAYLAYGNNSIVKDGFTDKNGNKSDLRLVSLEMWLPTLGKLGHLTFGESYNVIGGTDAQDQFLLAQGCKDCSADLDNGKGGKIYSQGHIDNIKFFMKENYSVDIVKANTFFNRHEGDKWTYYKPSLWGGYGNVEFIQYKESDNPSDPVGYASFNYGNHWWTHFFIDYLGYKWRNY